MQRHFILTMGRSGSNTLRDMLNQHPQILNFGEVLGEWNKLRKIQRRVPLIPRDDEAYLDWILYSRSFLGSAVFVHRLRRLTGGADGHRKSLGSILNIGVKEFSLNLHRYGLPSYLDDRRDIKVIGLVRRGIVERMLSSQMLAATGAVSVPVGGAAPKGSIRIDPERISFLLEAIEQENRDLEELLHRLPPDRLHACNYEDIFASEEALKTETMKIFDFLGLPPVPLTVRMAKIIRRPIGEVVINFDECLHTVRGTRFERMLQEAAAA
jgi:hypothetical protein